MINAQELADIFLDEAHNQARSISFQEFPDLTPQQKVEKAKEHNPLPERDVIAHVFEEVFWASLLTEESRPCGPRLIYRPRQAEMSQAIHRLVRPVELTREHLRKLTPVQTELPGTPVPPCGPDRARWPAPGTVGVYNRPMS